MEIKYNRVANIDEKIKNAKLTYLQWKVLFLVIEDTGAQELIKILSSSEDEVTQSLEILEKEQLIELVETASQEKEEIIEPVGEEIPLVIESELEAEAIAEQDQDDELEIEPEVEEMAEEPDEQQAIEAEKVEELIEEPEVVEDEIIVQAEEDLESTEILIEEEEDFKEKEEDLAEVVEETEELKDSDEEEKETESSDISSFIEELGGTGSDETNQALEPSIKESGEEKTEDKAIEEKESTKDSKTIMVVDDSIVIRKMVEIALEDDDFNIITSNSGKEGLKLLDDENPQLVILDMTLPDMNGIDFLKAVKASKGIPVIMLSGKDAPQLIESAKNAGADDFLPKPFRDEDLVEKVKNLVK